MSTLGLLSSMTGFGRAAGEAEGATILVELRSVNARGLDIRTRLAPGFDWLDADIRKQVADALQRGTVQVYLSVQREGAASQIVVNHEALDAVLAAIDEISARTRVRKPAPEGILALKGVLETRETELTPDAEEALRAAVRRTVATALAALVAARREEGCRVGAVLVGQVAEIERLVALAEVHPSRSREAIRARLAAQVAELGETGVGLSEERLAQEALLLATKADIREELDRFAAHIGAARALLTQGGPVGRKLDFLAQEFNREANTLCSKSNDVGLTAIGLDLKAVIDQLREQVQNLE